MPNDVDVQKALVVCDDDVACFFWNVFGPCDRNFDAEQFENNIPEHVGANFGAIFPMSADAAVKGVRDTRDDHNAEDNEIVK